MAVACAGSEQAKLGEALGAELASMAADEELAIPMSAAEARCWGAEMASVLGVERWAELGVEAPDYELAGGAETDEDIEAIYAALDRCIPVRDSLRRFVSTQLQLFLLTDVEQVYTEDKIDCFVDALLERDIDLLRLAALEAQYEPTVTEALVACELPT